jgi:hypothetical protein
MCNLELYLTLFADWTAMHGTEIFYCLTWHGTILCLDETGAPRLHEDLGDVLPGNAARFSLHCASAGPKLSVTATLASPCGAPAINPQHSFGVMEAGTGRAVHLSFGDRFVCANLPDKAVMLRPEPKRWETFIFLPETELHELLFARNNQWLTPAGELLGRQAFSLLSEFKLRIGKTTSDLRFGAALASIAANDQAEPTELVVMCNGWQIAECLKRFHPLIYYAAFGPPEAFELLRWSTHSLAEFGHYKGNVHVISDRPAAFIAQYLPAQLRHGLTVQICSAASRRDFYFSRYKLTDWAQAFSFQPLLYVDNDIAFDRPVENLLKKILQTGGICAGFESFSKRARAPSVGAPLFKQAGIETGDTIGFNSGCQGFANLAAARRYFSLVKGVSERYWSFSGAEKLTFLDQPFANYVSHVTEPVHAEPITSAMRLTSPPLSTAKFARKGLVHFWHSPGAGGKTAAMRRYLEALTAADGGLATIATVTAPELLNAAE